MMGKRTSTTLVEEMMACNLKRIAQHSVTESKKQWDQRKKGIEVNRRKILPKKPNMLRGVPNIWCSILKLQTIICPKCKKANMLSTSWHMKYAHGINTVNIRKIWNEIRSITRCRNKKKKLGRKQIFTKLSPILSRYLRYIRKGKQTT